MEPVIKTDYTEFLINHLSLSFYTELQKTKSTNLFFFKIIVLVCDNFMDFFPSSRYISDAKFGRFKTMVMGFLLYISGYILLTLMAVDRLPRTVCFSDKGWGKILGLSCLHLKVSLCPSTYYYYRKTRFSHYIQACYVLAVYSI